MPRKPREEAPGAVHHVFARGNDKQLIYRGDADRRAYLSLLQLTIVWARWRCLAYCLMDNHVHLLVETPDPNLGVGMQRLHGKYAREFNDRHGRSGHVFQGRFGSKRVTDDEQMWTAARYVARNPVEAGLCRDTAEWEWGSHGGVLAGTAPGWLDVDRLMWYFAGAGGRARVRYRRLVDGDAEDVLRTITVRPRRTRFG